MQETILFQGTYSFDPFDRLLIVENTYYLIRKEIQISNTYLMDVVETSWNKPLGWLFHSGSYHGCHIWAQGLSFSGQCQVSTRLNIVDSCTSKRHDLYNRQQVVRGIFQVQVLE